MFETLLVIDNLLVLSISEIGDSIERLVIPVEHDSFASISQKTLLTNKLKKKQKEFN